MAGYYLTKVMLLSRMRKDQQLNNLFKANIMLLICIHD